MMIFLESRRHPILSPHTITCIKASREPSGSSMLPAMGLSSTARENSAGERSPSTARW